MVRRLLKKNNSERTKRGVASLYVVIFATILFGIVSLSFMRIILSEAGQSSDDDLSRSAYDAALAGVEDAKRAVNSYYRCLQVSGGSECTVEKRGQLFQDNCDNNIGVATYLGYAGYDKKKGVLIQEGSNLADGTTFADQAYTCVIVSDKVPDYRGTLTSDTRTKVVPLNIGGAKNVNTDFQNIKTITLSWYSQLNMGTIGGSRVLFENVNGDYINADGNPVLADKNNRTVPPTITATLIIAKNNASRDDFYQANNQNLATRNKKVIYSTKVLVPNEVAPSTDTVTWEEIVQSGNVIEEDTDKKQHTTVAVKPDSRREFACVVNFDLSGNDIYIDENDTAILVLSLPYGDTETDFSVEMKKTSGELMDFSGAQISVDSTGRTNQLLRRVEVRLDPADLFFPYPQYEVDLSGDGGEVFKKDFWITANCWYSQKITGWTEQPCDNNNRTD